MPIKPENAARYPKDWKKVVVQRIRARSGDRCECLGECGHKHFVKNGGQVDIPSSIESLRDFPAMRCTALNRQPHPVTKSMVVLTTAHLGLPAQLPFFLHVTGYAVANEVVDLVGFLMPSNAERPKWRSMMDDRSTARFFRSEAAGCAGFFIAFPSEPPSLPPGGAVVGGRCPAGPVGVFLTGFSLFREPSHAAGIAAEPSPGADVESAYFDGCRAGFAPEIGQAALSSAYGLTATGRRTSFAAISSLLRCNWEWIFANDAHDARRASSGHTHGLLYHIDDYPENCADNNLRHMCQRCHLRYDSSHHQKNARVTRFKKVGQEDFGL